MQEAPITYTIGAALNIKMQGDQQEGGYGAAESINEEYDPPCRKLLFFSCFPSCRFLFWGVI